MLALLLDAAFGEPPARVHPVVWVGAYLRFARSRWRAGTPRGRLVEGGAWWLGGALLSVLAGLLAERVVWALPGPLRPLVRGALLKPALSVRALLGAVREVEGPLRAGDLPGARRLLAWHLVSRDTSELSEGEVAGAAVSSLLENLSDSAVAPAGMFLLGGLPLAYLYRFANTADAMWGYRSAELEWSGKVAARADDALNVLPARVTGLLVALAAPRRARALRVMLRDAHLTPSPNGGWPMAAGAGALGVRLEKRGQYVLGAEFPAPEAVHVRRARALAVAALALGGAGLLLGTGLLGTGLLRAGPSWAGRGRSHA